MSRFPSWIAWLTTIGALAFGAGREWRALECRQEIEQIRSQMMTREMVVQLINDLRPGPPWAQERGRILQMLDDHQHDLENLARERQRGGR